jgi:hypothetical protein
MSDSKRYLAYLGTVAAGLSVAVVGAGAAQAATSAPAAATSAVSASAHSALVAHASSAQSSGALAEPFLQFGQIYIQGYLQTISPSHSAYASSMKQVLKDLG